MTGSARLASLLPSWELALSSRNLSPRTIELYRWSANRFCVWLEAQGRPQDTDGVGAGDVRAFLHDQLTAGASPASADIHRRTLRVLFAWLIDEGERTGPNPVDRAGKISVPADAKPILSEEQLRALLKACEGNGFAERRDTAVLRIMIDTGVRASGLAGILVADVNLRNRVALIRLKGGDAHVIPLGRKAAAAVDRYLRVRARHPKAELSPYLWLGTSGHDTGHMTRSGIHAMISRRGKQAGIEGLSPHWFRRTAAHDMLAAGLPESAVMAVAGWRTTAMLRRYTADLAAERARSLHAERAPGDRI